MYQKICKNIYETYIYNVFINRIQNKIFNNKLKKKYKSFKLWNYSFMIKHNLDTKNYFYIIIFYIFNISLLKKDFNRFSN
jgi:hypothetical protein